MHLTQRAADFLDFLRARPPFAQVMLTLAGKVPAKLNDLSSGKPMGLFLFHMRPKADRIG